MNSQEVFFPIPIFSLKNAVCFNREIVEEMRHASATGQGEIYREIFYNKCLPYLAVFQTYLFNKEVPGKFLEFPTIPAIWMFTAGKVFFSLPFTKTPA